MELSRLKKEKKRLSTQPSCLSARALQRFIKFLAPDDKISAYFTVLSSF